MTGNIIATVTGFGMEFIDAGHQAFALVGAHPLISFVALTLISFLALPRGGRTD